MSKKRKATKWEQKVLDIVLKELRRAVRENAPIEIMIDPWLVGRGAYINAARYETEHRYSIEAE